MKENVVVSYIEKSLNYKNRYFINVHGSIYSQNGTPDIITSDKNGRFLAIEVKAPNAQPKATQFRHAIKILKSDNNSRVIIAYDDFNIEDVDNKTLPIFQIGSTIGESEYEALNHKFKVTTEIVLK